MEERQWTALFKPSLLQNSPRIKIACIKTDITWSVEQRHKLQNAGI